MISDRPAPDAILQYNHSSQGIPPTVTQSVFNSFNEGIYAGFEAFDQFQPQPNERLRDAWDALQLENQQESSLLSFGQKALRFGPEQIANIFGSVLNPITQPLVSGGGLLGKGLAAGLSRLAPEAFTAFMRQPLNKLVGTTAAKYLPDSLGQAGVITAEGAGSLAGFSVPEAAIHNYNRDTKSLSWGGFTEEVGINGGLGALLSMPGFALGVVLKKVFGKSETIPMPGTDAAKEMPERLKAAVESGKITQDEYKWATDLYENPHDPDLSQRAAKLLSDKAIPVDRSKNKPFFDMLGEDDWKNLSSIFPDQLNAADVSQDKSALSDYVLGTKLDKMREDPHLLDGLRGFVDEAEHKLSNKDLKLAEADKLVEAHLHKDLTAKMPFDQHDIYAQVKAHPNEHLPYTVPERVQAHANHVKQIAKLKKRIRHLEHVSPQEQSLTALRDKLDDLQTTKPELHSAKEELADIHDKLLGKRGLPANFQMTKAYQRLVDLADVWHNAQTLLDRVHLEANYKQLEAYKTLAQSYRDVLQSNVEKFADPDRAKAYLKQRIDQASGLTHDETAPVSRAKPKASVETAPSDEQLNSFAEQVKDGHFNSFNEQFNEATKRYKQFKQGAKALADMINCLRSKA